MKVVYVSYDGALDPLGTSQVVRYLLGLSARGVRFSLISFEKRERWAQRSARERLAGLLADSRIRWRPLLYHKRPRVPATLWDCWRGMRAVSSEARRLGADIVHCRGDVAMAMARWARLPPPARLLYDVRSFFADERAESGSWRPGGLLDRAVRGVEAGNRAAASGIVVVSEVARELLGVQPAAAIQVIPGCADVSLFTPRAPGLSAEFGLVYSGSLGSWYLTEEMVTFARGAGRGLGRALFLTPQLEAARRAGASADWAEVRTVAPDEVPAWLNRARAQFFFIRPTRAKRTSFPVKLAEGLAAGLPVVANRGIGDLDGLIEREGVGVFVNAFSEPAYQEAARRLGELLEDPATPGRCRALAEARYSLEWGVDSYEGLYASLLARQPSEQRR